MEKSAETGFGQREIDDTWSVRARDGSAADYASLVRSYGVVLGDRPPRKPIELQGGQRSGRRFGRLRSPSHGRLFIAARSVGASDMTPISYVPTTILPLVEARL